MVVMIAEGSSPTPCSGRAEEIDPRASEREATASQAGVTLPPLPLDELLSKSDFFSVHCPLTADTKGMISRRELALMKPSAVVINAARGGVVDEIGARVLISVGCFDYVIFIKGLRIVHPESYVLYLRFQQACLILSR